MTNRLTLNTSIPTAARGKVRAFIKSHGGWDVFCVQNGIVSREAKNRDLLTYAIGAGLDAEVLGLINAGTVVPLYAPVVVGAGVADAFVAPKPVSGGEKRRLEAFAAAKAAAEVVVVEQAEIITEAEFAEIEAAEHEALGAALDAEAEATLLPAPTGNLAFEGETLLAEVEQFLSPIVKAKLVEALAPVIAAANKPAVVQTVEVVRTVEAEQPLPVGARPRAVKGNAVELGKLFGFKGPHAKKQVHLWEAHGAAPSVDPMYVVDPYRMAMAATALDDGENVWLFGPGGSGKTTLPEQFCAFTGRPFVRINFTRNSHVDDMVGGNGIKGGDSGFEDGVLIQAMRTPGCVILLDEITLAPPGVQGLFQACADEHRVYTLPTGEKVKAAPGVVFCVADNTAGNGDDSGIYQGTNQSNGALVNRFAVMLEVGYMTVEQEAQALHNRCPGAPIEACRHMAEFVARARKLPQMEAVILSLRNMQAFTKRVLKGFTPKEAAEVTILSRLPKPERAAMQTLFTLTWEEEFADLIAGKPLKGAPLQQAPDSAGAAAFDDGEMPF